MTERTLQKEQQPRKLSLRERLDPDNRLPSFSTDIYKTLTWDYLPGTMCEQIRYFHTNDDGDAEPFGYCDVYYEGDKNIAHFDGVEIDEDERGKGIGLAIYLDAIGRAHAKGYDFVTQDAGQSEDAKRMWEFLAEKAVARMVIPFREGPRLVNGHKKFYGEYVVDCDSSTIEE